MAENNTGMPPRPSTSESLSPAPSLNNIDRGRPTTMPRPTLRSRQATPPAETKDSLREIVETVVFVVVLVLLLKAFVAEAFVIPTGSMAETLYGYQKMVKCPKCALEFPVNCSQEVDPQQGPPIPVVGCICPNC